MKRNLLKLSFVLFGLLFVLAACGAEEKDSSSNDTANSGAGEAAQTEGKTFKIGTTQIVEHPSLDAAKEGLFLYMMNAPSAAPSRPFVPEIRSKLSSDFCLRVW